MNCESKNIIPWLFTDFDSIKDFPLLFKKILTEFSLALEK